MHFLLKVITFSACLYVFIGDVAGTFVEKNQTNAVEEGRYLLFPSLSTMQLSICTSSGTPFFVPKKKYPFRRLGVNIGFQVNYNLPYRLKDFYSFPTWARSMVDIVKGRYMPTEVVTARATRKRRSSRHLSAGDVYTAIEEVLQLAGYDKDCVIKSVCELSHSPFHNLEEDLYTEVLHFLLTPSEHQAFGDHERKMKLKYEMAEKYGRMGADCSLMYPTCRKSFLTDISGFLDDNKLEAIR
ncbi:uncharacterized protein LOC5563961 [Aedes aegypti]|uniref:Uncharacterized protein n=1 Tax=Aedes aegypti TaxID=7159 RepID=A0A903TYJ6_AEDAE|nr:uncharacterized protein LOC5563961 [Aedes aegypti]